MVASRDEALVPDPGYPVYAAGTMFAGATAIRFTLKESQGFIPRIIDLDRLATPKTRVVFVNYPNNPTGATAPLSFYEELTAWAERRQLVAELRQKERWPAVSAPAAAWTMGSAR